MVELSEFNDWLRKGLGRAVIYLKTHDPQPCREALLHACLYNLAYDSQCEGSRETYLLDLIRVSEDREYFRNRFWDALVTTHEDSEEVDLGQVMELARNFAAEGDREMRKAMYEAVLREGFECAGCLYSDLIKLDGLFALKFAADNFPAQISDGALWQVNCLVSVLQERDGERVANDAIWFAAETSPRLAQMLEKAQVHRSGSELPKRKGKRLDYAALKQAIEERGDRAFGLAIGWGRTASPDELQLAATDLLLEEDEKRLVAYLSIFRFQRFPRPIARLLELAHSNNVRLTGGAVSALSQLTDPEIRKVALQFLDVPGKRGHGADLLANNYAPGDFHLIEARLRELMGTDEIHHFEMGVRHLAEVHCPEEAANCFLLLYEKGPCSLCRGEIVERLISLSRLPDWMKEECRYDSDTDTRKLVS
jgi:hypothetical protein